MKSFLMIATLVTLTACCGCLNGSKMTTHSASSSCAQVKVSGMTCEACSITVSENLKKLSGVKDVQVDVGSGIVKIFSETPSSITSDQVKSIIEKSGYTFQNFQPHCN